MPTVQELFDLKGQVAIVTGGAGRLGSQMCDALAEAGAHVVVAARNLERCQRKAEELSRGHAEAMAIAADVTVPASVKAMTEAVKSKFGRIDIMVNNAYSATAKPFDEMTLEEFESATRGALSSTFLCSQAASREMKALRRGVIINISSMYGMVSPNNNIYGRTGMNNPCNYGAAKAGIIQLTRYMATHLAPFGIRVNCISPGGFYNKDLHDRIDYEDVFVRNYCERTPLGRMGNETDLKGAVVFLGSRASEYVTGHNLAVEGGWTAW